MKGISPNEAKPLIFVSLVISGAQIDRRQTNDDGYYYFLTTPRDGANLVFETGGSEVGRVVLSAGIGSSIRQDITIDWLAVKRLVKAKPGIISVKDDYPRDENSAKMFEKAMASAREKKTGNAIDLFKRIVDKDPKDFVVWTELGTLYFGLGKFPDAEAAYIKALDQKPDFMVALMNLGKLDLAQNLPEKAIVAFTAAVNADLNSADAFQYLGEAYLMAKQGSKAVIALNEAIRLAPIEKVDVHLRLAALYNAAGARNRAANEYKIFLEKKPDYSGREKLEKYIKENSN
ncbi:MAG TPA: tetratricopeptide repeat protein [Pyrinomonadaceae bacterium]|nr:tetratricopeptide repeat protein [Pyrinomonadaceae bacterium]